MNISSLTRVYVTYGVHTQSIDISLNMFKEYNGNPSSFGIELCSFFVKLGDGFKDVGCLSAKLVTHFKNIYDDISIKTGSYDYLYDVYVDGNTKDIKISCTCIERGLLYHGTPSGFVEFISNDTKPSESGRIPSDDDLIGNYK